MAAQITVNANGTTTFTDNKNYSVTIPSETHHVNVSPKELDQHEYSKPVSLSGLTAGYTRAWAVNNPTANSVNKPASKDGTPNNATPAFEIEGGKGDASLTRKGKGDASLEGKGDEGKGEGKGDASTTVRLLIEQIQLVDF
jgi:hypothetical protein